MEMDELRALLTPAALTLLDGLGSIQNAAEALTAVSSLRAAGVSPELGAVLVTQARLRERAQAKFGPFASRMLFTKAGLEQATRMRVAAMHAGRFRAAGITSVADLGCGIGGDALAFAGAGLAVLAVDADEVTAGIAAYNLAPFADEVQIRHALAQDVQIPVGSAVWLDPARRTGGHAETRRVGADAFSPPLHWAFELASRHSTGIKLGPGLDRDALPADMEAQWVSDGGSVVELVLWSGALARPGVGRAALVLDADGVRELTAAHDTEDEPERPLGAYLHEPDGAVIRARLIGDLARTLEAGMLAEGIAYLTADADLRSPFAASFRVREVLPADERKLAAALRERGIGSLEIKKRGVDVDPAVLRQRLKLKGSAHATLLLTKRHGKRLAILADRV